MFIFLILSCQSKISTKDYTIHDANNAMELASSHYKLMLSSIPDTLLPRTVSKNNKLELVKSHDWTSGFFPGVLWNLYTYNNNAIYKKQAIQYTNLIKNQQYNHSTHDLGFMLYCSYGNGYSITNDTAYKKILLNGAKTLSSRFNTKVGCIKSWDWNPDWQFPVIVDNMMNLEYLLWAFNNSNDSIYYHQAISHADITLKNHFRPDNSSCHMIDYDTITGAIIEKITVQGYADDSAWSRGQAWGLYGYTMMYQKTKKKRYLIQAQKIVDFIFSHPNMPTDLIPYWDYNAPNIPDAPRDVSAATIIASALLELQHHVAIQKKNIYFNNAKTILNNLSSDVYTAKVGTNNNFILKHSTGYLPKGKEIDVPLIYADYYYIEALLRYIEIENMTYKN
ncbi:MAG: glucuronyl hydrolase [Saprospiraceae bacterium]